MVFSRENPSIFEGERKRPLGNANVGFGFENPWKIPEKFNAERQIREATSSEIDECDSWRCFLDEVRTYFEQYSEDN
jgi:hypothetical protein